MKRQLLFFTILILLFSFKTMAQVNNETKIEDIAEINYFDGSGNEYLITVNKIKYIPITKMMSSSGIYSGGKKKSNSISDKDFLKIKKQFEYLFNKTDIHIEKRIKTSGLIRFTLKNSTKKSQIIERSKELEELEKLLKSKLNKK